jgi:hypothetical protein
MMRQSRIQVMAGAIVAVTACTASAQPVTRPTPNWKVEFLGPEIPLGPTVRDAPYCGDAATTVSQALADGTQINRSTATRVCRDSEGRVRREQTILGLGALDASADAAAIVTIVDPIARVTYVLDPRTQQARRLPLATTQVIKRRAPTPAAPTPAAPTPLAPPPPPPPPLPGENVIYRRMETANPGQSLGTKQLEGLEVVGHRRVETIPVGRIGNDRPIEITDERWESTALKIDVLSRHHDPRTGDIEYRLTNINRSEPPRDLFAVPAGYEVVDTPDTWH